jgi:hypothetical protein
MTVRGIFASHSSIVGDRRTDDFAGRLLMNGFGGTAPMLALSSGMPKEAVRNTEFSWLEDDHISGATLATETVNSSATDVDVADSNIWIPNSILVVQETGEQIFVSAISGNNITISRGFAGTTPASITDGDTLQLISTAFAEGTKGAKPVTQLGESRTNYVQIFKQAWSITNTAKAIRFSTGSKAAHNRQMASMYLAEQLERAFMFGRPSVSVQTFEGRNVQLRTSGGIQHAIETFGGHVVAANANSTAGRLNLPTIDAFMRHIFDRNIKGFPNERITYTGSYVLGIIQQLVQDIGEYQIKVQESVYGIKVTKLVTFSGELTLLTHPLWVESDFWGHEMWVLHPAGIKRKVLRDLQVFSIADDSQVEALDAEEGHLRTELGFEVKGVKTMGMITNIQTAGGVAALPNS